MKNHVLYFTNPFEVRISEESIPLPKPDEVLVKNVISGISAGTEMLFYRGLMPTEMSLDATIPSLKQQTAYPFKYGYCSVGNVVEVGNKKLNHLLNRWIFVFNPHESFYCAKEDQVIVLPEDISPHDALFLANMETAVNLVLDGTPMIGENVLILGLGIVGLLTTALLQQFPLSTLTGIDFYQKRRELCLALGAKSTLDAVTSDALKQCNSDLIYELTGNPEALNSAITSACYEARIVLGSWYGKKPCAIDLGGKFHRSRIQLIASQVSTIASELQGRWNKSRRFDVAFDMLRKIKPSCFISHTFHITDADKAYKVLHLNPQDTLQITLTYEE